MLPTRLRVIVAIAAAMLLAAYVLPLWRITLEAPQYPEGIGMLIWTHTVTGIEPHHLQNINGLNHYIGMKAIDATAIPELRIMPWVLGALIAAGLAAAAIGRRSVVRAWVGVFAIGALAGIADFWKWQYDYGHNLDPSAAIKIPGMTYQPPLFGSRQLLNFTATSWPAGGGLIAFASIGLGIGVLVIDARSRRRTARRSVVATAVFATVACAPAQPRALVVGEDSCTYCRMVISDVRFGAQVITGTGKVETFDSIECLAGYANALPAEGALIRLFVANYAEPGSFMAAESATYVAGGSLDSPMGRRLAAFGADADTTALRRKYGGDIIPWSAVKALAASSAHEHGQSHEPVGR